MAINIARARDQLQWYGGFYTLVVSAITAAKMSGKPVPVFAAIPVAVGGFFICNMADMGIVSAILIMLLIPCERKSHSVYARH